jgi:hypothetical protein
MIYAQRIRRLATRVAESRRPKRLDAATRLARDVVAPQPPADRPSALPAVTPAVLEGASAPTLPLSEQATRWLTQGEAPGDLIPLLGDPTLPERRQLTADPSRHQQPADLSKPFGDPANGGPAGAGSRQVLARITEGGSPPSAAPGNAAPTERAELGEEDLATQPGASAIFEGIPGAHQGMPPLMRLARSPQQPSAQELARVSGGELSDDGIGTSTVTFRAPVAPAGPTAPAARAAGRPAAPPTPPAGACDTGQVSDASATKSDIDIDELYEGFLQRLRRDLIHDRERLGDLLGPQR